MRTTTRIFAALAILLVLGAGIAQGEDDVLFRAMQDELDRSMSGLSIENMPAPYFLSYRIQSVESALIEARYGALVEVQRDDRNMLYIECRVGGPSLDNSNFVGTWQDLYNMRKDLVEEEDYDAIRHSIWLHTDAAYKSALENLARKGAYLQSHPVKEEIPDFAAAEPFVHVEDSVSLEASTVKWQTEVRNASDVLADYPSLQDWSVTYQAYAENRYYVNSEGSRHLKAATYRSVEVVAMGQAEDGQRMTSFLRYMTRDDQAPPTAEELIDAVREMAEELEAMLAAPTLDEYAGPVLFTDYAATQFVSQLFAAQLSPTRAPLTAEEWMKQYLPDPKLAGRVNRRVFPEFVTVRDDPGLESWEGMNLAGYQVVDDEGVPSQAITLVEDGRLVTLPMSRQPTKKIQESNGHARTFRNQWTAPVVTNLIVETEKPKKDLVKELRGLCRDFDVEFGLLITRLEDRGLSNAYRWTESSEDKPPLLSMPVAVYKVYEKDGRMEPVRGLAFDELTIRSLRDIAALGKEASAVNLMQPLPMEGAVYPATIVTPDILVEELEFTASTGTEPVPVSARPEMGVRE